jgi:hypothetical protein
MIGNNSIWSGARNMLVFYLLTDIDEFHQFRKSIEESTNSPRLNKSLFVVVVENNEQKSILPNKPYFLYLTKTDFNFFGRLKNKDTKERFNSEFDLMLVYGALKPYFVKLANKSKVKKRVAISDIEGLDYDIRLAPMSNRFNQIALYTKEVLGKIQP